MLDRLFERFQNKHEPLSPEQLAGSIDHHLKEFPAAIEAIRQADAGNIPFKEADFKYDLAESTRRNIIRELVERGLWQDPKKIPSVDQFIALRNRLNPEQPTDNVVELDQYRGQRD